MSFSSLLAVALECLCSLLDRYCGQVGCRIGIARLAFRIEERACPGGDR